MIKIFKKIKSNKLLLSFFLSIFLGLSIIIPQIIWSGSGYLFFDLADYGQQQIAFNMAINNALKNGNFLWAHFNGLGSNLIGTFSFYNMFSPFNIIGYLFPAEWFKYLAGPIFILKYGIAGLTASLYLKRYVKNQNYAVIGGLLYAFSGFQLTNMPFYHFHDAVAFFPLLLYTLDNLIYENKKGRFALIVTLCAFTNWFFLIGEIIFLIIYYIIKVLTKSYPFKLKQLCQIFIEGLIGCGLAAIILIPTFLFTIGNPRVSSDWSLKSMLLYNKKNYFEIIRAFLFPNSTMYYRPFIQIRNYASTELYLPLVSSVLTFLYLLKRKKSWESILFIICIILMFIPILNSSFVLFTSTYYSRWFFIPILLMSLMSVKALEQNIKISKKNLYIFIIVVVVYIISLFFVFSIWNIIHDFQFMVVVVFLALINLIITTYISSLSGRKKVKYLYIFISLFIIGYGNYIVYKYNQFNDTCLSKFSNNYINVKENVLLSPEDRINTYECNYNLGYLLNVSGIHTFNSNINSSTFKFYNSLNVLSYGRQSEINVNNTNLNNYLGVKYIVSCDEKDLTKYEYEYQHKKNNFTVYYNPNYKQYGFYKSKYMSIDDFNKLSNENKAEALNNYVILNDDQIKKYQKLYSHEINYYDNSYFKYVNNGFESVINTDQETLAIFTIPYDEGWSAFINNQIVDVENVDNGMMAIKLEKGKNNIKFKYFTPGLKLGIIISIISVGGYIIYIIINKRRSCL